jgi:hypothetical protein
MRDRASQGASTKKRKGWAGEDRDFSGFATNSRVALSNGLQRRSMRIAQSL